MVIVSKDAPVSGASFFSSLLNTSNLRRSLSAMPPNCNAAAPSARDRKIVRKDKEAERQHPEAENWQKAENATEDKQCAGCHSCDARARHWDPQRAKNQLAVFVINTETLFSGLIRSIFLFSHPQEMGASDANTS
ncbi:exopolysaccharide biosynthesis predicted pyruvyl transferase EpsI [Rhizobium sp. BK377]|nr:exopolysaccharide biosynthesis predicted pyruvyl transferase EpsI [Rhizobium sp. BK377]